MQKPSLRVLFLAAEADPLVKIGGLGDVAGSLPSAMRSIPAAPPPASGEGEMEAAEIDVRLVIPFHGVIDRQAYPFRSVARFSIPHVNDSFQAEVFTVEIDHLPVYLIGGSLFPSDAPVYTADASVDGLKFTFFSLAALELARSLNWVPHLIHANDWHTSPAIYALRIHRGLNNFYNNTATVLGLHNLPYLGIGAGPALAAFDLPPARDSLLPEWAQQIPLPLGLLSADHIVAASPTYAREILTKEFGSGLQDFLNTRADSISGILNGIDIKRWDPRKDPALLANYSAGDLPARQANKLALQRELELSPDPGVPLFAMISRMDPQKGVDLVPDALRQIANLPWQVIILGTGDPTLEAAASRLEGDFPDRARAIIRYDSALSRRIYGGADALLIPSRYEPCGLTQMIAMRYGCVPVARATGGLKDTIHDYDTSGESTGFLFDHATPQSLAGALARAVHVYAKPDDWRGLQHQGMVQDFSWERSARQYIALYQSLVMQRSRKTSP